MNSGQIGVAALALFAGMVLVLIFWLQQKLGQERRRAEQAESKAKAYLVSLERLARSLAEAESPVGPMAPGNPRVENSSLMPDSRYHFASFERELARARRQEQPLTVMTIDVAGREDEEKGSGRFGASPLLRRVAHAIRSQMRGVDTCVRYGPDEFIVIFPGISREEAEKVESRLRLAVQSISYTLRNDERVRARARFGYASFPEDGQIFDQLLAAADARRDADTSPTHLPSRSRKEPTSFPLRRKDLNLN